MHVKGDSGQKQGARAAGRDGREKLEDREEAEAGFALTVGRPGRGDWGRGVWLVILPSGRSTAQPRHVQITWTSGSAPGSRPRRDRAWPGVVCSKTKAICLFGASKSC
ncbi:hypothetical protein P7K49_022387 [Saguinus oedipus]|uniref:Uncharacterized protein n=1 Tax=Saguinus oedipus TaxID=9490 RepID=A0ABQ9UVA7_SAGOE|nr:hypothetical protein P7K49_022387 [Saguinus oedipus]